MAASSIISNTEKRRENSVKNGHEEWMEGQLETDFETLIYSTSTLDSIGNSPGYIGLGLAAQENNPLLFGVMARLEAVELSIGDVTAIEIFKEI